MQRQTLLVALLAASAAAFRAMPPRSGALTRVSAVEGTTTTPLEYDGEGWPVISRDPKEPLPEEFVEKQRVALEALRKDLLRERFERESAEAPLCHHRRRSGRLQRGAAGERESGTQQSFRRLSNLSKEGRKKGGSLMLCFLLLVMFHAHVVFFIK
eukprot:scaffold2405_cov211-Pinguiococcus_pyrenoidosus.AAC.6